MILYPIIVLNSLIISSYFFVCLIDIHETKYCPLIKTILLSFPLLMPFLPCLIALARISSAVLNSERNIILMLLMLGRKHLVFHEVWCWLLVGWLLSHGWLFCGPTDCSPPRLLCPWDFQGRMLGGLLHFLSPRNLPTQGLNHISYVAGRLFTAESLREPKCDMLLAPHFSWIISSSG